MTALLLRLFVKDHTNTDSPAVRAAVGRLAGGTGILCNCLLAAVKFVAGLLCGAISVVADAVNNLGDCAAMAVTLLGFRLARRPADKDHPYGHARYEYLSGLVVAAMILLLGVELAHSSVRKILSPEPPETSVLTLVILVLSVVLKLWMSVFFRALGKKIGSCALLANAADSRNDVIATAAVLLGYLANILLRVNIDGWIGLAVAVFIVVSGVRMIRDTVSPVLGKRADPELVARMTMLILSHEKVLGIHDLLVHDYGPGQCYASVHVEISAAEDPLVCHDIIDDIEWDAMEELGVHLVIHYDPVVENDTEQNEMRRVAADLLFGMDPRLSMHDFRLVRGARQTKLVFDLSVPYDMIGRRKEIKERLDRELAGQGREYLTVIRFDGE